MGVFELRWFVRVSVVLMMVPKILGWGKEGHYVICKIAEEYLTEDALAAVKALLPDQAEGDLAAVCSWADEVRLTTYRWSSPLHYVDTPDFFCNYKYCRDCHDGHGHKDRRKTNLHHVWDTIRYESALKTYYNSDLMMNGPMMFHLGKIARRRFVLTRMLLKVSVWPRVAYRNATPGSTLSDDYFLSRLPVVEKSSEVIELHFTSLKMLRLTSLSIIFFLCLGFFNQPGVEAWSKEGHMMTCRIAQNFTTQLSHYREGTSDRRHNMTEALLFLSHFMGDIHQVLMPEKPVICAGLGINQTCTMYGIERDNSHSCKRLLCKDVNLLEEDIEGNFTDGIWSDDLASWRECGNVFSCVNKFATETGETLSDDYFKSRLPIVMKRIAQRTYCLALISWTTAEQNFLRFIFFFKLLKCHS
ncbi:hypothetical protein HAX54_005247 [Datura stramonium]|uniref:Aspergillus nuclease S1 n=1 Tax=Datura stramonium TaxID=4076 RepID=A0ABS8T8E5_DATST|nr:hypothetical protein [Datura stramonium]